MQKRAQQKKAQILLERNFVNSACKNHFDSDVKSTISYATGVVELACATRVPSVSVLLLAFSNLPVQQEYHR